MLQNPRIAKVRLPAIVGPEREQSGRPVELLARAAASDGCRGTSGCHFRGYRRAGSFRQQHGGRGAAGNTRHQPDFADLYRSRFLEVYGRPSQERVPERDAQPNLNQALHILAGTTYTEKLWKPGGRLQRLLERGAADREVIEELYLAAMSRLPGGAEEQERLARVSKWRKRFLRDRLAGLDDAFFSPPLGRFHSSSSQMVRAISVTPRPA